MTDKTLLVAAIKNGTVIDHIPAGQALTISHLLKSYEQRNLITIGMNLPSKRQGHKDLIKIESRFLTEKEAHDIAVFAPEATINIIRDFRVVKKIKAVLPKVVERILVCPNARCITHSEETASAFSVEEFKHKVHLRCKYCEQLFERDEIKDYRT